MRFLLRLIATAAALWVAVWLVPGIEYTGHWAGLLGVAVIFGAVNAVVRPLLKALTCPLILITLGLFVFVLNALMLWLTAWLSGMAGLGFFVHGFWAALLGALVVGFVSAVLSVFTGRPERE